MMRPDDGRVISNFICQSILNKPITIYGDGLQTRSFCHVNDLILGLKNLMNCNEKISHPINLGNPDEFTLLELVNLIEKVFNTKLELKFLPLPLDDPKMRKPDISMAKKILGWEPKFCWRRDLKILIIIFNQKYRIN